MPSKLCSRSHQENVKVNSYCKTLAFAVGASRKYQNWCAGCLLQCLRPTRHCLAQLGSDEDVRAAAAYHNDRLF